MNKKRTVLLLISVVMLIQFLMVSCAGEAGDPSSVPISIDDSYLNQQITLVAPSYFNTFKTSDSVWLELNYHSADEIIFPNNYGIKIFSQAGSNWVEIKEKITIRTPSGNHVFSPTNGPAVDVIDLFPDLESLNETYQLRIYVIGEIKTNGGIKTAGAYTDVVLLP